MRVVCGCVQSVEQVAFADIILLNKSDLVTEDDKKRVTGRIKVRCSLAVPSSAGAITCAQQVELLLLPIQILSSGDSRVMSKVQFCSRQHIDSTAD